MLELLLVIAILSILASVTIIAINPAKQFQETRDAERLHDVYTIMNALHQYASDNDGQFPEVITTEQREICRTDASACTGLYDLSVLTATSTYLVEIPMDPLCEGAGVHCSSDGVGYLLQKTANGRIQVTASSSEAMTIDVVR